MKFFIVCDNNFICYVGITEKCNATKVKILKVHNNNVGFRSMRISISIALTTLYLKMNCGQPSL